MNGSLQLQNAKKTLYIIISVTLALLITATAIMSTLMICDSLEPTGSGRHDIEDGDDLRDDGDVSTGNNKNYTKRVALTFDDGPHVTRTKVIVDELAKYDYHATFFVVGNRVDGTAYSGGNAMKYAYDAGNEIAIHGYTHEKHYGYDWEKLGYDPCTEAEYYAELNNTVKAIQKYIPDYKPTLMRPIGGSITAERADECDYSIILWNVDSFDWQHWYSDSTAEGSQEKRDTIINNVMSKVTDGSIILMHDIRQSTVDASIEIIRRLHEEGYEIVTVSELIGNELKPGTIYSKGTPYKKEGD